MSEARVLERRPHILGNLLHVEPEYRGLELQRIRQSLGFSGKEVAGALGVSVQKIVYAESGHPSYARIRKQEQVWLRQYILGRWPFVAER